MMKNKPDDRSDNADKIQRNISNTIENFHLTEEAIENADDQQTKKPLEEKNHRRQEAINGMKSEMKDESMAKRNGYK